MEKLGQQLLDCAVAGRTLHGESESGDQYLVEPFADGALVAVVDGLGHGAEAAEAARIAVRTLREHANEPVTSLIELCQEELVHSRGAVMSLASFRAMESTLTWIGVGNVSGLFLRADVAHQRQTEMLLLRPGVVGRSLPKLRASVLPIRRGDTLIFASDGVKSDFYNEVSVNDSPQATADRLLAGHIKGADDAMVLVARFQGDAA